MKTVSREGKPEKVPGKEKGSDMLRIVGELAVSGSKKAVNLASELVDNMIKEKGESSGVAFPETGYYLPLIYATLGKEVTTLKDVKEVSETAKSLLKTAPPGEWPSLLNDAMDSGVATALAAELIEAMRYASGELPKEGWQGFIPDSILRSLGIQLVDGRISGVAVIVGAASDSKKAVKIIRELQEKNILSLLVDNVNGESMTGQLLKEKVQVGLDFYIVPVGEGTTSVIHAANFAIRASLAYGGNKKGELEKNINYCKERVPAFILALGGLDDLKVAAACAAIRLGFPVITDQKVPEIKATPFTLHEALISEEDYSKIVPVAMLAREIKVKIKKIPIPVAYSAAFEGERVRRQDMYVQFGGKFSSAFEYVRTRPLDEIEDGKIEIIGPEIDDMQEGGAYPIGILIEVAGRKMQHDFEPILERQVHSFLNEAMGIFHMGQRNMCWIRISKDARKKGFKLKHFGTIIHARLHDTYGKIVDRARIIIYTKQEDVDRIMPEAVKSYEERDARLEGMTDESVDTFYCCTLCQSFAPNHLCMVKPERLGLCGAYSWLDAKACYELNPTGPNQPVKKGEVLDAKYGEWKGINDFVHNASNKKLERFHAYSIMTFPETSCGCFECIISILPEANGFMVVSREYSGLTPAGMKFSTLAGSVGGGNQTPGFMGVGRLYIVSKKFLFADGGLKRLVWMPRELKEALRGKLKKRCEEEGMPDLFDRIADESVAVEPEALLKFLEEKKHPALTMPPLV